MGINISIIPARGGSKELPRKNIKLFHGKPLIAYSIESAKSSQSIDRVIVSTDDEEIADISKSFGAEVIMRPEAISADRSPSEDALIHVVNTLESSSSVSIDFIVFLQATSPLRPKGMIDQCLKKMTAQGGDSLVSVYFETLFYWREENGEGKSIHDYKVRPMRQDVKKEKKIYRENGSLYIMKRDVLMKGKNRLGGKIILYPMKHGESLEIDSEFDFWLLEKIAKRKN
jgi:N-acylneuraminate cytidylyltransferase